MPVDAAFAGFLKNRLVVGSGIAIVMLAILFTASSFKEDIDRKLRAKQVNLVIRQIGHRLLLQAADSTSRVLPVTQVEEGTFLLKFEKEFVFNHDSLIVLSQGLLPKTAFPSGYTVTVHDCLKGSIIYGFQVNNTSPDILACSGRSQPAGCYTIEFAFPDFYEKDEQEKAGINPLSKSIKVDAEDVNTKHEELKTKAVDYGFGQRTKELKSVEADTQAVNPKSEGLTKTTFGYPLINVVFIGMLVLLGVTLMIVRFGKILNPVRVQNEDQVVIEESVQELPVLGKFLFNVKDQRLLSGSEVISLTDKECKVLELLNKSFGELIPRETLMQKVWIDEGVITGRSLDMFVSKLRKKLSSDPDLRITNVHGKGYKLEMPGVQTL
jgi:DNA-binding winged helix-turn-helix (wHTH) protein